jgi:hypothetical protein
MKNDDGTYNIAFETSTPVGGGFGAIVETVNGWDRKQQILFLSQMTTLERVKFYEEPEFTDVTLPEGH